MAEALGADASRQTLPDQPVTADEKAECRGSLCAPACGRRHSPTHHADCADHIDRRMAWRQFLVARGDVSATIGFYGSKGPFWPLPSTFLTGTAVAAGMALINSVSDVCGFIGAFLVGWIKDATGNFENGAPRAGWFHAVGGICYCSRGIRSAPSGYRRRPPTHRSGIKAVIRKSVSG
jgi:hypothetical protein